MMPITVISGSNLEGRYTWSVSGQIFLLQLQLAGRVMQQPSLEPDHILPLSKTKPGSRYNCSIVLASAAQRVGSTEVVRGHTSVLIS